MKVGFRITLLQVAACFIFFFCSPAQAGEFLKSQGEKVPGEYLVVFRDGFRASQVAAPLVSVHGGKVEKVWQHAVNGAALSNLSERAARELAKSPMVAWVEENTVYRLELPRSMDLKAGQYQYNPVWGLDRIDHRRTEGAGTYIYDSESDGEGVNAYIIDSGIRTSHAEFGTRASNDWDAFTDGQNGNDCYGHGTHVAGIVGATTYGVAKQVRLRGIRVFNCDGRATATSVTDGIDWVRQNFQAPAVANMSLGGGVNQTLDTAVNNLINAGVFVAVAAGNDNGADACNTSPARVAAAYTVGATTSADQRSSFSNIGTCVDIFAPGSSILSTWHTSDTATQTQNGTSMATPYVTGLAARIRDENPNLTPAQIATELTNTASCNVVGNIGNGSPNRLAWRQGMGYRFGLTAEGVLFAGRRSYLYWGGSCAANVDVFRNGVKVITTANDGAHMDLIPGSGSGSFNYWVCEAGSTSYYNTATCSNVGTAYY